MGWSDYSIATIGSHTALQILKGAKEEGFRTIAICLRGREKPYKMFGVADEIILLNSYGDFETIEEDLVKRNAILIPHGSYVAYLGTQKCENLKPLHYGNKNILKWESNRKLERQWLQKAGIKTPLIFDDPNDIDRLVIVKFDGALGGKGYFLAKDKTDFFIKIKKYENTTYQIQEYIIGVPVYVHYFYSQITGELEIMGFDKRYESNVDSLGRISAPDQMVMEKVDPSYVVVGNVPIVIRESLLPKTIEMGEAVIQTSKELVPPGLFGPFCLEGVITPEQDFYIFEISARIVAGTNPYIKGSPYTHLKYDEPMSSGRRIARDIKEGLIQGKLDKIFG